MENLENQEQVNPVTRKKLLAKALCMDSSLGHLDSGEFVTENCENVKILKNRKPLGEKDMNRALESVQNEDVAERKFVNAENCKKIIECKENDSSYRAVIRNTSQKTDRRSQFLFESRYSKRMADLFLEKMIKKMQPDPEFFSELLAKHPGNYETLKLKYIEIHQAKWVQACIDEIQVYTNTIDTNSQLAETKKYAFLSFINTPGQLTPLLNKAKSHILKSCNLNKH